MISRPLMSRLNMRDLREQKWRAARVTRSI
jgi:hypothetical protein